MSVFTLVVFMLLSLCNMAASSVLPANAVKANMTISDDSSAIQAYLYNNCGFSVYARQAIAQYPSVGAPSSETCPGYGETQDDEVPPGWVYRTPLDTYKNSCGSSMKVSRNPGGPIYQYEFSWSILDGKIWYNLSDIDGNPFTDVARQFGGPDGSGCSYMRCEAGDVDSCIYPVMASCDTIGDLIAYLC